MSILIFIFTIGILVFVHELGHFIFAKKTGMLVEEFAVGFPPRIFSFRKGETRYSIGLIPIGGFVKIYGEDYTEENGEDKKDKNFAGRFTSRPKWAQALVLIAGVSFNFLLAWLLISAGFMSGLPVSVDQFENARITDTSLMLFDVLPDSPAEKAGLETGDIILYLSAGKDESVQDFANTEMAQDFITLRGEQEIEVLYKRGLETVLTHLTPQEGLLEGRVAIGVTWDIVGKVKFPFFQAFWEGAKMTVALTAGTITGLFYLAGDIFTGNGDLSQISGPLGIVSLVGSAFQFGFVYLLSFVALISINLAIINLIPIPALDGGRLLFVAIEALKGSPIKAKIANGLNLVGFALLILLMLVITVSDALKIF